ncbi:unnamed protein product, partial [marine sediment metagenome]
APGEPLFEVKCPSCDEYITFQLGVGMISRAHLTSLGLARKKDIYNLTEE